MLINFKFITNTNVKKNILYLMLFFSNLTSPQTNINDIVFKLDSLFQANRKIDNFEIRNKNYIKLKAISRYNKIDSLDLKYSYEHFEYLTLKNEDLAILEGENLVKRFNNSLDVYIIRTHNKLGDLYLSSSKIFEEDILKAKHHTYRYLELVKDRISPDKYRLLIDYFIDTKSDSIFYYFNKYKDYSPRRKYLQLTNWYRSKHLPKKELEFALKSKVTHEILVAYRNNKQFKKVDSIYSFYSKILNNQKSNINLKEKFILELNMAHSYASQGKLSKAKTKYYIVLDYFVKSNFAQQAEETFNTLFNIALKDKDFKSYTNLQNKYLSFIKKKLSIRLQSLKQWQQWNKELEVVKINLLEQKNVLEMKGIQAKNATQNIIYISIIIGFILLLILGFRYLFDKRKKNKLMNEIYSLKINLLGSKFKPHFTYNILNTVNYFLEKGENGKATKAILKLTKLMRVSLDNMKEEFIPYCKEIEMCSNYLELEKLRFKDVFTSSFQNINDDKINNWPLPPGILEPIVENAVNHAFDGTNTQGKITITHLIKENNLIVKIADNGIGFDFTKTPKKGSYGLNITKKRMELLSKIHKKQFTLNFYNQNGTVVILSFPKI